MAKKKHETPMLDELEQGPWPSFVTGLKRLAENTPAVPDDAAMWPAPPSGPEGRQ